MDTFSIAKLIFLELLKFLLAANTITLKDQNKKCKENKSEKGIGKRDKAVKSQF